MDQNNTTDPKLVQGFNDGYIIAKFEPGLAEKLSKIDAVSSYLIGIQNGREQYLKDQLKTKLPDYLKEDSAPDKNPYPSKDKDKGMEKEF
ncbi:hypothetical protein [Emticicia fluvialis]|uniref:hypothetical protein n=1 Tax=Emticicia fluvialis TaxID=2974474 RepID=UPI002165D245|nr:hypothetical protein [Emticicia fluvialis]